MTNPTATQKSPRITKVRRVNLGRVVLSDARLSVRSTPKFFSVMQQMDGPCYSVETLGHGPTYCDRMLHGEFLPRILLTTLWRGLLS